MFKTVAAKAPPATPRPAMAAAIAASDDGGHLTTYPGGKNGAGIFQRLISLMPPHRVYVMCG